MRAEKKPFAMALETGRFDRLHFALMTAATAAAMNRPVTLLFSMAAIRLLNGEWPQLTSERHESPAQYESHMAAAGIAEVNGLLNSLVDLGAHFIVCETGLRAMNIKADSIDPKFKATMGGLASFLAAAGDEGQVVIV